MTTRLVSPTLKTFFGLVFGVVATTPIFAANPKIDATTLTVIGYHEITEHKDALIPSYAVTAQQFSQHIDWLKNNGFHFINVDQLIKAHQGQYKLPSKPVLLTVDDGYQSFYQNANPQGNLQPAAITRIYDAKSKSYENDADYQARVYQDLKKNNDLLKAHGLRSPRVMVWPYGRYNMQLVKTAKELGMPITITLDDGADQAKQSIQNMSRILIQGNMSTSALAQEIKNRELNLGDNNRPQKIMHVDLDYIYDPDPQQQERNLGHLLDRINGMGVNTVYLQAFSDPDANGSADRVYFPNRHIPMRADLFNRVAWQIQTRTQVQRLYAWMPLLAWELPKEDPVADELVETQQGKSGEHLNMGYIRLSPFSPEARQTIKIE